MRAVVLEEPGRLHLVENADAPSTPAVGEALVRVRRVGICGTDFHAYRGRQPFFTYPRILGHELAVEVVAVGARVGTLAPGDLCAVEPYLHCGACVACRRGRTNCCASLRVLGVHVDGGLCEHLIVPAAKLHRSARLDADALALVEPLCIGAHAVARAALDQGEASLVIGAGPIGLAVTQAAVLTGARVTLADVNSKRLEGACERFPDILTIDAGAGDAMDIVRAHNGGELPTAVFDATGSAASMRRAFDYVASGGRLIFVGLVQEEVAFSDAEFHRREITLLASRNATAADFAHVIRLMDRGEIDARSWITHRAALAELPSVFETWSDPASGCLKGMVEF